MAGPSAVLSAARARRSVKIEWFDEKVVSKIKMTMHQRVLLATKLVESKVISNISVAVKKETGPRGGTIVTQRSVAGEFPRADTTQLLKTLFSQVKVVKGSANGYIGTPLDYGLILETSEKLNRSFLVRTLNESRSEVMAILMGPIK